MSVEIDRDAMLEELKEDNKLLTSRIEAYKERINDLEKKLEYSSKIVLLYENVINFSKQETKDLEMELRAREEAATLSQMELQQAYEEIMARESVSNLAQKELKSKDDFIRYLEGERESFSRALRALKEKADVLANDVDAKSSRKKRFFKKKR